MSSPHATQPAAIDPPALSDPAGVERRTITRVRDAIEGMDADGVVVALDGRVASSVLATLMVEALHRHAVYGLIMPTDATTAEDIDDALSVAATLGIESRTVDIQPLLDAFAQSVVTVRTEVTPDPFSGRVRRITTSPVDRDGYRPAKAAATNHLRATALCFEAATTNRLVAGSETRTDRLLGATSTLGEVDLCPLRALYATEVRQLAASLGIPDRIARKPALGRTAGIVCGNDSAIDEPALDAVLRALVEHDHSVNDAAVAAGVEPAVADRIADACDRSAPGRTDPSMPEGHGNGGTP